MVRYAAEMMLEPAVVGESAPVTNWLLSQIAYLDDWGAWEWNLRWAALFWLVVFAIIRLVLQERGGVNWYALIHAIITGLGGVVCSYLSFVSAEHMTGTPEPLGTILCHGPLTSLHRVLPTAAVGYSVFDLLDGIRLGSLDFAAHGAVMFAFSTYIMEVDKNEVLAVMLTLEFSTIFLNLIRVKFPPKITMAVMAAFTVSFFFSRIVFGPYAIYQHSYLLYTVGRTSEESKQCLPRGFDHVIFITGMFFNILNAFWFYKILRKLERKIKGKESVHSNNRLGNATDGVAVKGYKASKKEQD